MDYGHKQTDEDLKRLEKRISQEYDIAAKEVEAKTQKYLEQFEANDAKMKKLLDSGDITKSEYAEWRRKQMLIGDKWKQMKDDLTKDLVNADKVAAQMIRNSLPETYALNRNYGMYEVETGANASTSFSLVDESTVRRLLSDDPHFIPQPSVNVEKDSIWNRRHITSAITQGILQGESIPNIAKRLRDVTDMDKSAAIRNARTYTTAAENAGRQDSYEEAQKMGIQMEKMWISTLDERTRDSHRELDGVTVPVDESFEAYNDKGEKSLLKFPADPDCTDPSQIYNCRCTLISKIKNVDYDMVDRNSKLGDMSYEEWKNHKSISEKSEESTGKPELKEVKSLDPELFKDSGTVDGNYAYSLAKDTSQFSLSSEEEHLFTLSQGDNIAFVHIWEDEKEVEITTMGSTGGGLGTDIFVSMMERAEEKGLDFTWMADHKSAMNYYSNLGLDKYINQKYSDSKSRRYDIPNSDLEELIKQLDVHNITDTGDAEDKEKSLEIGMNVDLPYMGKGEIVEIKDDLAVVAFEDGTTSDVVITFIEEHDPNISGSASKEEPATASLTTTVTETNVETGAKEEVETTIKVPDIGETKVFDTSKEADEYFRGSTYKSELGSINRTRGYGVSAEADKPATKWENKLTSNQTQAIVDYSGAQYQSINNYLRGIWEKKEANDAYYGRLDNVDKAIKNMDGALKKFDLKEPITVYRTCEREFLEELQEGSFFHDEGFGSTSVLPLPVASGDVHLEIDVPAGKGVGAYIDGLSWKEGEEFEFLLARGADYYIESIEERKDGVYVKAAIAGFTREG